MTLQDRLEKACGEILSSGLTTDSINRWKDSKLCEMEDDDNDDFEGSLAYIFHLLLDIEIQMGRLVVRHSQGDSAQVTEALGYLKTLLRGALNDIPRAGCIVAEADAYAKLSHRDNRKKKFRRVKKSEDSSDQECADSRMGGLKEIDEDF